MGDHHYDGYRQSFQVLLVLNALVGGDQRIETIASRQSQQIAVLAARPTHALDRADLELVGKVFNKLSGKGLVK